MMAARSTDLRGPARRRLAQHVGQVGPSARPGAGRRTRGRAPSHRGKVPSHGGKAAALDQPDGDPRAACSPREGPGAAAQPAE